MAIHDQAVAILKQALASLHQAIAMIEAEHASGEAQPNQAIEEIPSVFDSSIFYGIVRGDIFGGTLSQSQVDGLKRIGNTCLHAGLSTEQSAYVLATVYHESAHSMQPVRETLAASDDEAIRRLEVAWTRGKLTWVKSPYWRKDDKGRSWFGRGDVQLTHEENYEKQQSKLEGHPMRTPEIAYQVHDDPALALKPQTSALIAVLGMRDGDFTGKRLADYIQPGKADYVNARRIVNGTDRASQIAGYARLFERAIREAA